MKIRIIASLIGLFVLGGVCGYTLSSRQPAKKPETAKWSEKAWLKKRFEEDVAILKLSPEQVAKLHEDYRNLEKQISKLKEETRRCTAELFHQHTQNVLADLTPEQQQKYQEIQAKRNDAPSAHP